MECPICYDTQTLDVLNCSHSICKDCICKLKKRICPMCRIPINVDSIQRIDNKIYSYEINFTKLRRKTKKRTRKRTQDHNREIENIITRIFNIHLNENLDLYSGENESEVHLHF